MSTPYALRNYSGAAVQTTIVGGITNASSTFVVADGTSFPAANFFCVADEGTALEEKVFVGSRSGNTFSSVTRGEDGPAAQAHAPGATIRHCFVAQDAAEANAFTAVQTTKGDTIERGAAAGPLRLPVGADGTIYTASSAAASGKAWTVPGVSSVVTTAARDALAGANLYRGRGIFNSDTGAHEYYYGATTLWKPPWNTAWGEVGYAEATGAQAAFGPGVTDITGATVTFTAIASRRYEIVGNATILQNVAGGIINLYLTDAANTSIQLPGATAAANSYVSLTVIKRLTGLAGSVTYKLRASSTAGTISMNQGAPNPTVIRVIDVGPNGNAPAS